MKRLPIIILISSLILCCAACGRRGMPRPATTDDAFGFAGATASMTTLMRKSRPMRCLSVTVDVSGRTEALDDLIIELEPQTDGICTECPFLPSETSSLFVKDTIRARNVTRHTMHYCPRTPAKAYRWRLIGTHRDPAMPNVISRIYGPLH